MESGERGWIGGFGIAPSHRGRGLAAGLMREQLDVARDSGVRHVQLEVLTQNWAGRSYARAGFVTTRRLLVLQGTLDRSVSGTVAEASGGLWLDAMGVPDRAGQLNRLHRAHPAAWTREPQSVLRDLDGLRCLAVGPLDALEGALILAENEGVLQVADAAARDAAAAERLVSAIVSEYQGRELRVVNEPGGSPLAGLFARVGLAEVMAQYEMHRSA